MEQAAVFAPFRVKNQGVAEASDRCVSVETVGKEIASLEATLIVARVFAESGRTIDLEGLDVQISTLCNQALSLPEEQGRAIRSAMILLDAELDRLYGVLALKQPQPASATLSSAIEFLSGSLCSSDNSTLVDQSHGRSRYAPDRPEDRHRFSTSCGNTNRPT